MRHYVFVECGVPGILPERCSVTERKVRLLRVAGDDGDALPV